MKKIFLLNILILVSIISFSCNKKNEEETRMIVREEAIIEDLTYPSKIDMSKWLYNNDDHIYYQLGIDYCLNPKDEKYEKLAIFVNDKFMDGTRNGDGTYTCKVSNERVVKNYISMTAPIVMPVETPGYSAAVALTEYKSDIKKYTDEGFIYVYPGCRGREHGAPLGVVDLKAAVRYIKYNKDLIPGDTSKIFTFGMSGGGAQSALLGITGDSPLYEKYLDDIGAVKNISDSVFGSMAWCPITNLDSADMGYEWNMGESRKNLSDYENDLSKKLSIAYVNYINSLNLVDGNGDKLLLEDDGNRGHKGSYYELIKYLIEDSLNKFLSDTTFPYTVKSDEGFVRINQNDEAKNKTDKKNKQKNEDYTQIDDIKRNNKSGVTIDGVYETKEEYIKALNKDFEWVNYDKETETAKTTSISDFSKAVKIANKSIGAFDSLDKTQGENILFGFGDGEGAHFDKYMAELIEENEEYLEDLNRFDYLGIDMETRVNMYSPLYFLLKGQGGYNTVNVAEHFRIRSGIWQSDTPVTTEINLAMALSEHSDVKDVDFEMVWGMKHVKAERFGDSDTNFIQWVNDCMGLD